VQNLVRVIGRFVEVCGSKNLVVRRWQVATIRYISPRNHKPKEVLILAPTDSLPKAIKGMLYDMCNILSEAAGVAWWCLGNTPADCVVVCGNIPPDTYLEVEIRELPQDWRNINKLVPVKVIERRRIIYEGKISIFDIFDFVVFAFTLLRL
jgi:hypothetical protein